MLSQRKAFFMLVSHRNSWDMGLLLDPFPSHCGKKWLHVLKESFQQTQQTVNNNLKMNLFIEDRGSLEQRESRAHQWFAKLETEPQFLKCKAPLYEIQCVETQRVETSGLLLLWKGRVLGPRDFMFVSGLVFLPKTLWILWPHAVRLVSHLSPSTLWMLWVLWSASLSPSCLPLHSAHDSALVSQLSPATLCHYGFSAPMMSGLSPLPSHFGFSAQASRHKSLSIARDLSLVVVDGLMHPAPCFAGALWRLALLILTGVALLLTASTRTSVLAGPKSGPSGWAPRLRPIHRPLEILGPNSEECARGRGEGSRGSMAPGGGMGTTRKPPKHPPNQHGIRQEASLGTSWSQPAVKRSLQRARARAQRDGWTFYRGRFLTLPALGGNAAAPALGPVKQPSLQQTPYSSSQGSNVLLEFRGYDVRDIPRPDHMART